MIGGRSRFAAVGLVRSNLASEPGMQRVHVGITPTSSSSCRHHHSNSHLRCRSLGPLDWAKARSGPCSLADLGVPPHLLMGVPSPRCTHAQGYRYLFYCVTIIITQGADCDGACGAICATGGRRPCRVAATSASTSACDRSRCGDSGHARGGHTMATGVRASFKSSA